IYVAVDAGTNTVNASTAALKLSEENWAVPSCSKRIYAGLYWTGMAHDAVASAMSSSASKVATETYNANEYQNLTNGNLVNYSTYKLTATREGGSNNRYPLFDLKIGNSSTNRYRFNYTNNTGNNRITLQIGTGSATNVPATFTTSGSIETAVF